MLCNIRVNAVVFGILFPVLFSNGLASECQGGWIQNGTSCYYFSNMLKDWVSASASCRAHVAELVIIESQEENNFIEAQVKRIKGYFWLDGTDEINEGQWEWASIAEPFGYSNWNPGEPNDSEHNEDCLMTWDRYTNGGWNDVPCVRHYKYICERNIEDFAIGK